MNPTWKHQQTVISKLRVKCGGVDDLAARLRLSNLLGKVRWRPPGLSPFSIVCIRRLADPMPGRLAIHRDGGRVPFVWEQALASSVDRIIREASRPINGPVPPSAKAVLFLDEAELLACLASDYVGGRVLDRWWWTALVGGQDIRTALISSWLAAPEAAPAALDLLAAKDKAVQFIALLTLNEAGDLLGKIISAHSLEELRRASSIQMEDRGVRTGPDWAGPGAATTKRAESNAPIPEGPWNRWVSDISKLVLPAAQELVLGIGLMIRRAPAIARSRAFAIEVVNWIQHGSVSRAAITMADPGTATGPAAKREVQQATDVGAFGLQVVSPSPVPGWLFNAEASHPDQPAQGSLSATPGPCDAEPPLAVAPDCLPAEPVAQDPQAVIADESTFRPKPQSPVAGYGDVAANRAAVCARKAAIETELGGLFYLINLGIFLNLYGDFTAPARPGISLPIWDFVALLGRHFVGTRIESDPIWSLLADLAVRSGHDPPGTDFDAADEWRVPPEWLSVFPSSGLWRWSASDRRLALKHPQGFTILDIPLTDEDPVKQLDLELGQYSGRGQINLAPGLAEDPHRGTPPLDRWLNWLLPYAKARLGKALGLRDPVDISCVLFEHPAQVFLTPVHLDVTFELASHPIEVRMSGLDRNPGWVPSAGRTIAFHYE